MVCALTDSGHVADGEAVLSEPQKYAGFANAGVSDDDEFEQVVIASLLGSTLVTLVLCHLN